MHAQPDALRLRRFFSAFRLLRTTGRHGRWLDEVALRPLRARAGCGSFAQGLVLNRVFGDGEAAPGDRFFQSLHIELGARADAVFGIPAAVGLDRD